ncbi:hypothetical protein [Blautia wexlerae]|uniref:hypothetical protein n=1 Tax=Blautia wexlerae TaxID=418240 RepID=UPI00156E4DF1|nr:hypothetical protein [Blautia wexlerae]NSD47813.1 hypothetical protein [Blautia wexlerae]NSD52213.1 hypothetical protein [Blautia wexlerae]NSK05477.1 hypothetical protein [Blautia wexlerae]NSK40123.1 hypothetical protein [Blautia wexlerae]
MAKTKKTVYLSEDYGVIDTTTGELKSESGDTANLVMRKITVEELFEEPEIENNEVRFMDDTTYIRSFRGNGVLFRQLLTAEETQLALFLQDFVCYNDCILRTNGNKQGNPLTLDMLASMYGLKYDTFRKIMSSLKNKEVIAYHKSGSASPEKNKMKCITLNPYIFCRGMEVDKWISDYFSNSQWANFERQKIKKYTKD